MKPHFTFLCLIISACAARGSVPQQFSTDIPDRLYVESQERRFSFQLHRVHTVLGESWITEEHGEYWSDGNGGNGENLHTVISEPLSGPPSTDECHQTFDWAPSSWPTLVDASLVKSPLACDSFWGTGGYPLVDKTYCDIPANKYDQYFPGDWILTDCSWHTETKMSLFTGGKALPRRMNLFVLTGSATEITEKYTPPVYTSKSYRTIANTKVVIGDLGALGSDGRRYVALPDGATHDVTPRVKSKNYYSFLLDSSKHKPYITANGHNLVDEKPEFCVGQKVTFALGWDQTPPGLTRESGWDWVVSAKCVNTNWYRQKYVPPPDSVGEGVWTTYGSPLYANIPEYWRVAQPYAWWISGGNKNARLDETLTFANGQVVKITAKGKFGMLKPHVTRILPQNPPFGGTVNYGQLRLLNNAMWYHAYISKTFPGKFGITQTINYFYWTMLGPLFVPIWSSTHGDFWLDKKEYYDDLIDVELSLGSYPSDDEYPSYSQLVDAPGFQGIFAGASCEVSCHDYVRFTPVGNDSIPITVGRVDWTWNSVAEQYIDLTWHVTADAVTGPEFYSDDSFPDWEKIKTDLIEWEQ